MLLKNRLDGIGLFAHQTLKRLTDIHPEIDFIFFFDRPYDSDFVFNKNVKPVVVFPKTLHPLLYHIWFQYSLRLKIKKYKPDLFLSPDGLLPLHAKCKQLSVIHDLNFAHNPENLPHSYALYFNRYFPKSANIAARIATVSEFSKNDISETYKIDKNKIDVVYNGVDAGFVPGNAQTNNETRTKFTAGSDYFLFVGSIHPRKNVGRLLQAYEKFRNETKCEFKLLIVGPVFWGMDEITKILNTLKYKKDIIFTGRLDASDLKKVVAAAFCLTYPPYFEGFGVPVVEAMRCGVPVIASNTSSLPEIGGDAALYFDPFKIDEIKNAMIKIANDENFRTELISKGMVQSNKFTWEKTIDRLWDSIQKCLAQ